MKDLLNLCLFLVIVMKCSSLDCPTCQGLECFKSRIPKLKCQKDYPTLPFPVQLSKERNTGNNQYGCLALQYYTGKTLYSINQCFPVIPDTCLCKQLKQTVLVKQCTFSGGEQKINKWNINIDCEINKNKEDNNKTNKNENKDNIEKENSSEQRYKQEEKAERQMTEKEKKEKEEKIKEKEEKDKREAEKTGREKENQIKEPKKNSKNNMKGDFKIEDEETKTGKQTETDQNDDYYSSVINIVSWLAGNYYQTESEIPIKDSQLNTLSDSISTITLANTTKPTQSLPYQGTTANSFKFKSATPATFNSSVTKTKNSSKKPSRAASNIVASSTKQSTILTKTQGPENSSVTKEIVPLPTATANVGNNYRNENVVFINEENTLTETQKATTDVFTSTAFLPTITKYSTDKKISGLSTAQSTTKYPSSASAITEDLRLKTMLNKNYKTLPIEHKDLSTKTQQVATSVMTEIVVLSTTNTIDAGEKYIDNKPINLSNATQKLATLLMGNPLGTTETIIGVGDNSKTASTKKIVNIAGNIKNTFEANANSFTKANNNFPETQKEVTSVITEALALKSTVSKNYKTDQNSLTVQPGTSAKTQKVATSVMVEAIALPTTKTTDVAENYVGNKNIVTKPNNKSNETQKLAALSIAKPLTTTEKVSAANDYKTTTRIISTNIPAKNNSKSIIKIPKSITTATLDKATTDFQTVGFPIKIQKEPTNENIDHNYLFIKSTKPSVISITSIRNNSAGKLVDHYDTSVTKEIDDNTVATFVKTTSDGIYLLDTTLDQLQPNLTISTEARSIHNNNALVIPNLHLKTTTISSTTESITELSNVNHSVEEIKTLSTQRKTFQTIASFEQLKNNMSTATNNITGDIKAPSAINNTPLVQLNDTTVDKNYTKSTEPTSIFSKEVGKLISEEPAITDTDKKVINNQDKIVGASTIHSIRIKKDCTNPPSWLTIFFLIKENEYSTPNYDFPATTTQSIERVSHNTESLKIILTSDLRDISSKMKYATTSKKLNAPFENSKSNGIVTETLPMPQHSITSPDKIIAAKNGAIKDIEIDDPLKQANYYQTEENIERKSPWSTDEYIEIYENTVTTEITDTVISNAATFYTNLNTINYQTEENKETRSPWPTDEYIEIYENTVPSEITNTIASYDMDDPLSARSSVQVLEENNVAFNTESSLLTQEHLITNLEHVPEVRAGSDEIFTKAATFYTNLNTNTHQTEKNIERRSPWSTEEYIEIYENTVTSEITDTVSSNDMDDPISARSRAQMLKENNVAFNTESSLLTKEHLITNLEHVSEVTVGKDEISTKAATFYTNLNTNNHQTEENIERRPPWSTDEYIEIYENTVTSQITDTIASNDMDDPLSAKSSVQILEENNVAFNTESSLLIQEHLSTNLEHVPEATVGSEEILTIAATFYTNLNTNNHQTEENIETRSPWSTDEYTEIYENTVTSEITDTIASNDMDDSLAARSSVQVLEENRVAFNTESSLLTQEHLITNLEHVPEVTVGSDEILTIAAIFYTNLNTNNHQTEENIERRPPWSTDEYIEIYENTATSEITDTIASNDMDDPLASRSSVQILEENNEAFNTESSLLTQEHLSTNLEHIPEVTAGSDEMSTKAVTFYINLNTNNYQTEENIERRPPWSTDEYIKIYENTATSEITDTIASNDMDDPLASRSSVQILEENNEAFNTESSLLTQEHLITTLEHIPEVTAGSDEISTKVATFYSNLNTNNYQTEENIERRSPWSTDEYIKIYENTVTSEITDTIASNGMDNPLSAKSSVQILEEKNVAFNTESSLLTQEHLITTLEHIPEATVGSEEILTKAAIFYTNLNTNNHQTEENIETRSPWSTDEYIKIYENTVTSEITDTIASNDMDDPLSAKSSVQILEENYVAFNTESSLLIQEHLSTNLEHVPEATVGSEEILTIAATFYTNLNTNNHQTEENIETRSPWSTDEYTEIYENTVTSEITDTIASNDMDDSLAARSSVQVLEENRVAFNTESSLLTQEHLITNLEHVPEVTVGSDEILTIAAIFYTNLNTNNHQTEENIERRPPWSTDEYIEIYENTATSEITDTIASNDMDDPLSARSSGQVLKENNVAFNTESSLLTQEHLITHLEDVSEVTAGNEEILTKAATFYTNLNTNNHQTEENMERRSPLSTDEYSEIDENTLTSQIIDTIASNDMDDPLSARSSGQVLKENNVAFNTESSLLTQEHLVTHLEDVSEVTAGSEEILTKAAIFYTNLNTNNYETEENKETNSPWSTEEFLENTSMSEIFAYNSLSIINQLLITSESNTEVTEEHFDLTTEEIADETLSRDDTTRATQTKFKKNNNIFLADSYLSDNKIVLDKVLTLEPSFEENYIFNKGIAFILKQTIEPETVNTDTLEEEKSISKEMYIAISDKTDIYDEYQTEYLIKPEQEILRNTEQSEKLLTEHNYEVSPINMTENIESSTSNQLFEGKISTSIPENTNGVHSESIETSFIHIFGGSSATTQIASPSQQIQDTTPYIMAVNEKISSTESTTSIESIKTSIENFKTTSATLKDISGPRLITETSTLLPEESQLASADADIIETTSRETRVTTDKTRTTRKTLETSYASTVSTEGTSSTIWAAEAADQIQETHSSASDLISTAKIFGAVGSTGLTKSSEIMPGTYRSTITTTGKVLGNFEQTTEAPQKPPNTYSVVTSTTDKIFDTKLTTQTTKSTQTEPATTSTIIELTTENSLGELPSDCDYDMISGFLRLSPFSLVYFFTVFVAILNNL